MRYILLDDNINKYKYTKSRICKIFIENNEWTAFDIRLCEHVPYSQRNTILLKYIENKNIKYDKYIKTRKINLFNKKWWNDNGDEDDINIYITYQKTLINEREIKMIINESCDLLDNVIKDKHKVNIFYKYQPSIKSMI